MKRLARKLRRLLLAFPLAMSLPGCALFAWSVAQFSRPPKVKALYKPPKKKKIFVFVDDPFFVVTYEPIKGELTRRLNEHLTRHQITAATVDYEKLLDVMTATPNFNRLRVAEVGRKVGADIVLYVLVNEFALKDEQTDQLWQGRLRVTVRMVDVTTGRLWPEDREAGYPVEEVKLPLTDNPSPKYGIVVTKTLAVRMAENVAKLFHDHRPPAQPFRQEW